MSLSSTRFNPGAICVLVVAVVVSLTSPYSFLSLISLFSEEFLPLYDCNFLLLLYLFLFGVLGLGTPTFTIQPSLHIGPEIHKMAAVARKSPLIKTSFYL